MQLGTPLIYRARRCRLQASDAADLTQVFATLSQRLCDGPSTAVPSKLRRGPTSRSSSIAQPFPPQGPGFPAAFRLGHDDPHGALRFSTIWLRYRSGE